MKCFTLLLACLTVVITAEANCNNAYSSASYGLVHAKKSLSSDNFDHQRYYAERALTAFEKTETLALDCGCDASREPIFKGLENLKKAIDPKDWEMGRYYTKKALANAQNLMAALDMCTSGADSAISVETYIQGPETASELKNPEELEAQLSLKRLAELTLYEFEKSVKELASLTGCDDDTEMALGFTPRTEEQLESETLEQTRDFYRTQTIGFQKKALELLSRCTNSQTREPEKRVP